MVRQLSEADVVGLAVVLLGVVFAAGWWVRRSIGFLRGLFIPSSVVAGFLVLLGGEQVLGALTGTGGLFPLQVVAVWRAIPGLMINVVFGAIMIGKTLPSLRELWRAAAPHALMGAFLSFGQFALGGLVVLFLLRPAFGLPAEAGALLEMSFAGGHGTIAGMGHLLVESGEAELVDIGLGLATIGMVTGIVGGSALVRWAVRNPAIEIMRSAPIARSEDYDLGRVRLAPADVKEEDRGGHSAMIAFAAISLAILLAIGILWGLRWLTGLIGMSIFDKLPLFPVAMIGGFLVQLLAGRAGLAKYIDKRVVDGFSAVALDALLICAIGTMSLATLGSNVPAIIAFTVVAVGWSVITLMCFGRWFHRRHWFEHAIADFGQSQGNVATGFALADMADPQRLTSTTNDYGYKQLPYEPFLGGGLLTALSVPVVTQMGLVPFTAGAVILTGLIGLWGMRRR